MRRPGIEPGPPPWEGGILNRYTNSAYFLELITEIINIIIVKKSITKQVEQIAFITKNWRKRK